MRPWMLKIIVLFVLLGAIQIQDVEGRGAVVLNPEGRSILGWPFTGFDWRCHNESSAHLGDDAYALDCNWGSKNDDEGEAVLSATPGTVIFIERNAAACSSGDCGYGNTVIVNVDNRFAVRYAHLKTVNTALYEGSVVSLGTPIGEVGHSGLSGKCEDTNGDGINECYTAHLHQVLYKKLDQTPELSDACIAGRDAYIGLRWLEQGNTPCRLSGGPTRFAAEYLLDRNLLTATDAPLDVFLIVDLSGSFYDDLPVFKAQAPTIISTLRSSFPNSRFGLAKFEDYPIFPFGNTAAGDKAYERLVDLTSNTDLVLNTISGLFTRDGWDWPQSQLPALYQAATGLGQDLFLSGYPEASIPAGQQANFRDNAEKLFLIWTDAPFHNPGDPGLIPYPGPSFIETVNAIRTLDPPKVIGISSGSDGLPDLQAIAEATESFAPPGGVDCNADGVIDLAEGDPLVCSISSSGEGIGEAIIAAVEAAATPQAIHVDIDIKPGSDPNAINCSAKDEVVTVAILTTDTFDATMVDHTTVQLEGASETHVNKKSGQPLRHEEDVDGDGDTDLVFHFRLGESEILCEFTEAILTGKTVDGITVVGSDSVKTVTGGVIQP